MTYVEGFIVAVPIANRDAYRRHAAEAAPLFHEFGATRLLEAWGSDVPEGKFTDFRRAVQAREDETVVFSWFEYPSKEARDAANERMRSDPRMQQMGETMPFDGKRMVYGGFAPMLELGSDTGVYTDGFVAPVRHANKDAYLTLADKAGRVFREYGALRVVEAWGDDVPDGKITDFRRAVIATEDENVVFSWIEWPSKAVRDEAWPRMMADERMQPDHANMPFDGQRMFWGGFEVLFDSAAEGVKAPERENA